MNEGSAEWQSAWRTLIEVAFETIEHRIGYLCDPSQRRRAKKEGLTSILTSLAGLQHLLQLGHENEEEISAEGERLNPVIQTVRECADQHLSWVREQLQREFEEMVRKYHSAYWVEAIRDGLPHEFWYVLNERSRMEAHLRAAELLHPGLAPDPEQVKRIEETDALLRQVGPELWTLDPPTGGDVRKRELYDPRAHWWWWLDQLESDAAP